MQIDYFLGGLKFQHQTVFHQNIHLKPQTKILTSINNGYGNLRFCPHTSI